MQKKKVGIVIVHYGDKNDTFECLRSLKKTTYPHTKHYVVDNGTNTLKQAEIQQFLPSALLLTEKRNKGFSAGCNRGIQKALQDNCSYILILCNDLIVTSDIIEKLLKPMDDPKIGITGSTITYYKQRKKIWFAGGYVNRLFCFTRHTNMNRPISAFKQDAFTDFITGTALMIKREVFDTIGLFSDAYFLYFEDVDFCIRAKQHGFLVKVITKPLVYHKVSASTGIKGENKLNALRAYYYARNPFIFMKKNKYPTLSGAIGQFAIRLPYNIFSLADFNAGRSYLKGLIDGTKYLLKSS